MLKTEPQTFGIYASCWAYNTISSTQK